MRQAVLPSSGRERIGALDEGQQMLLEMLSPCVRIPPSITGLGKKWIWRVWRPKLVVIFVTTSSSTRRLGSQFWHPPGLCFVVTSCFWKEVRKWKCCINEALLNLVYRSHPFLGLEKDWRLACPCPARLIGRARSAHAITWPHSGFSAHLHALRARPGTHSMHWPRCTPAHWQALARPASCSLVVVASDHVLFIPIDGGHPLGPVL